jgi:methyltransferase (TIGR00027 family)
MKRERIAQAGWRIPPQLALIPIDFTKESLIKVLLSSSYDPAAVSFFSWLGVTYYLPKEAIFSTLKDIRSIAVEGSTVVFDYMDADSFIPEKVAPRTALMHAIARQVGEPMKSGFDPQALAADLRPLGLALREDLGPAELEARYFQNRTDRLHAFEHVHIARAECV